MTKNTLLKTLSILITFAMLLAFLPGGFIVAHAESGKCGDNLTWTLNNGVLTISGKGNMWDCNYGWDDLGSERISKVIINNGVTSIGEDAFYCCSALTSVTISSSVKIIGYEAFRGCTALTSVTIPNGVKTIVRCAFRQCTGLKSITIPDSVTSIGDRAFYDCSSLTSVTIPNRVTIIDDYTFAYCESLTSVTIPNSVTRIGDNAFSDCTGLTGVAIPDSVTSIGEYAFSGCNLTSVTIPDSVTSIGYRAFIDTRYYNNISNWGKGVLYIGKWLIEAKTDVSGAYSIKDGTVGIADYAFGSWGAVCTGLTSVTMPDSVVRIGIYAFRDCTGLTSVTIPDSVTSIGDGAFYDCTGLTSVTIPDSVTSIGDNAFCYCYGLTSVTIGNSVTSIGDNAFYNCTGLTSVTIPDSVTSIGDGAFYNTGYYNDSTNWEDGVLYIGKWLIEAKTDVSGSYSIKNDTVGIAGRAFYGCTGLSSITIPNSVTSIGDMALHAMDYETWDVMPLDVTLRVYTNSYAHQYAIDEGFKYELIKSAAIKGDADGDGTITVSDALAALRVAARLVEPTPELIACCDTDGDGKITVSDALAILRVAARLISQDEL